MLFSLITLPTGSVWHLMLAIVGLVDPMEILVKRKAFLPSLRALRAPCTTGSTWIHTVDEVMDGS